MVFSFITNQWISLPNSMGSLDAILNAIMELVLSILWIMDL